MEAIIEKLENTTLHSNKEKQENENTKITNDGRKEKISDQSHNRYEIKEDESIVENDEKPSLAEVPNRKQENAEDDGVLESSEYRKNSEVKTRTATLVADKTRERDHENGWPHVIPFVPVDGASSATTTTVHKQSGISFSVVSLNVLAESYLNRRSHPDLPESHASFVFDCPRRRSLLTRTLTVLATARPMEEKEASIKKPTLAQGVVDVLCLQEVDMYEDLLKPHMESLGYDGVLSMKEGRVDGCAIFWKRDVWTRVKHNTLDFDDVVSSDFSGNSTTVASPAVPTASPTTPPVEANEGTNDHSVEGSAHVDIAATNTETNSKSSNSTPNRKGGQHRARRAHSATMGIEQSFLRRNVAGMVLLRHRTSTFAEGFPTMVAVASVHLYWNPDYEYVKLVQASYLMSKLESFIRDVHTTTSTKKDETEQQQDDARNDHDHALPTLPIIIGGDMNSVPGSLVHRFFVDGPVDARVAAPWDLPGMLGDVKDGDVNGVIVGDDDNFTYRVRYLCDYSLNKFTRWLRMLGIDAELETEAEEEERTRSFGEHSKIPLFDRCRAERRTLLTTSYKLLQRKGCPPGAYLVNINPVNEMERTLCHLLRTHGVVLYPKKFLSRCVRCNGSFREILEEDLKREIFVRNDAPLLFDLEVWECQGCHQGYWWSERPGSSASRVKVQVYKLYVTALRAGVPCRVGPGSDGAGLFGDVNIEAERAKGSPFEGGTDWYRVLPALQRLGDQSLSHGVPGLRSVYDRLPFTNVTSDFVETLDYLFYGNGCDLVGRLQVPRSFQTLREGLGADASENAHLLPGPHWPSDHLAVGGRWILPSSSPLVPLDTGTKVDASEVHNNHPRAPAAETATSTTHLGTTATMSHDKDPTSLSPNDQKPDHPHERKQQEQQQQQQQQTQTQTQPESQSKTQNPPSQPQNCVHDPNRLCGNCACVPKNMKSLFEMAEARKKYRLQQKQAAAQKKSRSAAAFFVKGGGGNKRTSKPKK